jgi:hypothetical protein
MLMLSGRIVASQADPPQRCTYRGSAASLFSAVVSDVSFALSSS